MIHATCARCRAFQVSHGPVAAVHITQAVHLLICRAVQGKPVGCPFPQTLRQNLAQLLSDEEIDLACTAAGTSMPVLQQLAPTLSLMSSQYTMEQSCVMMPYGNALSYSCSCNAKHPADQLSLAPG
jgi:hypothetical protein